MQTPDNQQVMKVRYKENINIRIGKNLAHVTFFKNNSINIMFNKN